MLVPVYRDDEGELRIVLVRQGRRRRPSTAASSASPEEARAGDDNLLATALREAQEEVGLEPGTVTVLARLDPHRDAGHRLARVTRSSGASSRPDVEWRHAGRDEVVGAAHSSRAGACRAEPRAEGCRSSRLHFRSRSLVEGIDVEGHVLWGMTLRMLDDVVPRLLAGEWPL